MRKILNHITRILELLNSKGWTGKITFVVTMTGGGVSRLKVIQEENVQY